jgi:uncharacterized membrane protein
MQRLLIGNMKLPMVGAILPLSVPFMRVGLVSLQMQIVELGLSCLT